MAQYDNSYNMTITPNKPTLRGIDTNYDNSGQVNQGGIGLGDLYQLDYDRNKIEQIFNQGTDAQYALMQKENQIAQNQYANNQFANQQSALETLRQQRNSQIASGMARGLNAAQEQGTVLGLQQDASAGALELANQQQLQADKIAAEYASNVSKALQEANSVKQAMAQVAAQMYEADMLGYTGELNYAGQMDANASDRYGYDIGYEGTKYTADKNYEGTKYNADKNYEGTKYTADKNYEGTKYTADRNYDGTKYNADKNYEGTKYNADKNYEGTKYNADQNRAAQEYAADRNLEGTKYAAEQNRKAQENAAKATAAAYRGSGGSGNSAEDVRFIQACYQDGKTYDGMVAALQAGGTYTEAQAKAIAKEYFKNLEAEQTKKRENLVVNQPTTPLTGTDINGNQVTIQHPTAGPSTTKPFYQDGTYNRYIYPTDATTRLNQLGIKVPTVK